MQPPLRTVPEDADLKWEVWWCRPRLHCEPVPGRRAALPGQTLIGFDTASRRQEGAFLLLFFFSFISKRASFLYERPPPLLSVSPRFCCAFFGFLFHSWLYVPILTPSVFFFLSYSDSNQWTCVSFVFFFYRPSHLDGDQQIWCSASQHQKKIKHCPLLKYETIAVAVKTLGRNESASVFKPATYWAL